MWRSRGSSRTDGPNALSFFLIAPRYVQSPSPLVPQRFLCLSLTFSRLSLLRNSAFLARCSVQAQQLLATANRWFVLSCAGTRLLSLTFVSFLSGLLTVCLQRWAVQRKPTAVQHLVLVEFQLRSSVPSTLTTRREKPPVSPEFCLLCFTQSVFLGPPCAASLIIGLASPTDQACVVSEVPDAVCDRPPACGLVPKKPSALKQGKAEFDRKTRRRLMFPRDKHAIR